MSGSRGQPPGSMDWYFNGPLSWRFAHTGDWCWREAGDLRVDVVRRDRWKWRINRGAEHGDHNSRNDAIRAAYGAFEALGITELGTDA